MYRQLGGLFPPVPRETKGIYKGDFKFPPPFKYVRLRGLRVKLTRSPAQGLGGGTLFLGNGGRGIGVHYPPL